MERGTKNKTVTKHPRRREGNISKLKGEYYPKEFLFFDTETYIIPEEHDKLTWPLKLGIAIYVKLNDDMTVNKRTVLLFRTVNDFIDILKTYCKARKSLYVFAHNAKFDVMVMNLPMELDKQQIHSDLPIINERLFIWHMTVGKGTALFLDTANFGVSSVEQLGDDLGFPKMKIDFDKCSDNELVAYCRNDTEILERFMLDYVRFIHANNLGSFRRTLASQSLAAWRTRFMTKSLCIHNNEPVLALERKSYHGGRVECFRLGTLPEQGYYYLDVNSMYPYVMKNSNVPTRLMYQTGPGSIDKLKAYVQCHYVIAEVLIDTETPAYAVFKDNKLIFPTGQFRTILHQKELLYALQYGHVTAFLDGAIYKFGKIFSDYVDFFYKIKTDSKLSGNNSWYTIAKLLQNSLYGKLAQSGIHQEITYGEYEQKIERFYGKKLGDKDYESMVNWFGTRVKETKRGESTFSFPAAAGAVTANARMLLNAYIENAGRQNVLYCDTDSLIVNYLGYCNLLPDIDATRLGALKLEKQSNYVTIYGPKDYEFGADTRHKGVSSKSVQTNSNNWKVLQFGGIKPWFSQGTNIPANGKYINKTRKFKYSKGIVNSNTGMVTPLSLSLEVGVSDTSLTSHL